MYSVGMMPAPEERIRFEKPDDRKEFLQRYLSSFSPSLAERVDEVLEGRVKDFFTEPKIVDAIGSGLNAAVDGLFDTSYS